MTRLAPALPPLAFVATFGVFFVDKSREAGTVLRSWRGLLVVAAVAAGYVAVSLVVRRAAGRAWVASAVMAAVVVGLAAWIVRPYYVDDDVSRVLVAGPVGTAPGGPTTTGAAPPTTLAPAPDT
ncbi:MAG TPA: hypothetical protein VFO65_02575, partial [Acidimicrobiales bacterium]|nr:hypothetical protein [Acidimicrobiales bacterium]